MSWGCSGMFKSWSGMDVVSNRWEFIKSLFRGHIPLGSRDIQVQSFDHVTSSYLKWWVFSQILTFLAALTDKLPWTLADTWKVKPIFEMPK